MLAENVRVELVRVVPKDAVLVDLDGFNKHSVLIARRRLIAAGYRVTSVGVKPSRRHVHLIVRVLPRPRTLIERILLQALCGSDLEREANNLRRARTLRRMPGWARQTANVLYEKP